MAVFSFVLVTFLLQTLYLNGVSANDTSSALQSRINDGQHPSVTTFLPDQTVPNKQNLIWKMKSLFRKNNSGTKKTKVYPMTRHKKNLKNYSVDSGAKPQVTGHYRNDRSIYGETNNMHSLKTAQDQHKESYQNIHSRDRNQFTVDKDKKDDKSPKSWTRPQNQKAVKSNWKNSLPPNEHKIALGYSNYEDNFLTHIRLNSSHGEVRPEKKIEVLPEKKMGVLPEKKMGVLPEKKMGALAEKKMGGLNRKPELPDNTYKFIYQRPLDHYRCDVCSCHETDNETLHADCSYKRLSRLPGTLPHNIEYLDLRGNHLQHISPKLFSVYASLRTLILSYNSMWQIETIQPPCDFTSRSVLKLDLSNKNLAAIGDNFFGCFPNLESLNLSKNKLVNLSNATFIGISNLLYLNLSLNKLHFIDSRAFDNVGNMETLDMSRNHRLSLKSFLPRTFLALKKVKTLHIQGMTHSGRVYPTASLVQMINIEELWIDGVNNAAFDFNMRNLKHLRTLKIGLTHWCRQMSFTDSFFRNMPYLISVEIVGCNLMNLSPDLYKPIPLLKNLIFSDIAYPLDEFFTVHLSGLRNSSIKSLTISHVRYPVEPLCGFLSASHAKYLTHLTSLEELKIEGNKITLVETSFIEALPQSLLRISFNGNTIPPARNVLGRSSHLINLLSMEEKYQNHYSQKSYQFVSCNSVAQNRVSDLRPCSLASQNYSLGREVAHCRSGINRMLPSKPHFPPKLWSYSAAHSIQFGYSLLSQRVKKSSLRIFNVSNTYDSHFGKGSLFHGIEIVDFSYNSCGELTGHLFELNNSLREVHMAGNYLGHDLSTDVMGMKLSRLTWVAYFDLSNNQIRELPPEVFKGLFSLKVLILSRNNMRVFNISLSHMKSLMFLDLSFNAISWIGKESRNALDAISLDHELSLDLTSNPLPCTCDGIEILRWLEGTIVRVINKDFLECVDAQNKKGLIGDLSKRSSALQRACLSKAYLTSICVSVVVVFIIITCSVLVFRNRWRLYYIRNVLITKYYGFKPKNADIQYKFDAYILYTEEDRRFVMRECVQELEVKRGHKLCIEDRDFLPGSFVSLNIISSIQNSSVTLPVISPDFWQGEWTEYSLQMSVMEANSSKRRVLHLLLYKDVPVETMPADLIKVHNDNDFTEYPPLDCNEDVKTAFWDALSRTIGHTSNPEQNPRLEL